MEFTDAGDAIAICEKNGWTWEFKEPPVKPPRAKSYAANFSWNMRTRRSCKYCIVLYCILFSKD